jgi:hypothetical protein
MFMMSSQSVRMGHMSDEKVIMQCVVEEQCIR